MKKRSALLLFLLPLFALSACAPQKPTKPKEPPAVLKNYKYGYEITFPQGWSLHVQDSITLRNYAEQSNGDYYTDGIYNNDKRWATETVVRHKTRYDSFDKIYSDNLKGAIESFGPLKGTISKEKTYFRNGVEHREVLYESRGGDMPWGRHKTTFVDLKEDVLIVHSSCVSADFEDAEKDFESIADSIKLL